MAALDNGTETGVKEGVDQETVDAVREVGGRISTVGPLTSRWSMRQRV